MPGTVSVRRVVLIISTSVQQRVLREIERLGFAAHSTVCCSSRNSQDSNDDPLCGASHVRVEALGTPEMAQELMWFVNEGPLCHYSIVCFTDAVEMNAGVAVA